MSVQELLNLVAPRSGQVGPASCVQCASLRKQVRRATRSGNRAEAMRTTEAMRAHKNYGHPEETRPLPSDLPKDAPRLI